MDTTERRRGLGVAGMKSASAKQKGRKFQQLVRDIILKTFPSLEKDDVTSRSMGAGGEDILLSPRARVILPLSIECKCTEKVNIWEAYSQASSNSGQWEPIVCIKRNHHKPLVVVDAEYFIGLFK
jgi:hypothetical protein